MVLRNPSNRSRRPQGDDDDLRDRVRARLALESVGVPEWVVDAVANAVATGVPLEQAMAEAIQSSPISGRSATVDQTVENWMEVAQPAYDEVADISTEPRRTSGGSFDDGSDTLQAAIEEGRRLIEEEGSTINVTGVFQQVLQKYDLSEADATVLFEDLRAAEEESVAEFHDDTQVEREVEQALPTLEEWYEAEVERGAKPTEAQALEMAASLGVSNPQSAVEALVASRTGTPSDPDDPDDGDAPAVGGDDEGVFSAVQLPDWVLQIIQQETGGIITPEIESRIVDYANLYFANPGVQFSSIEEVAPLLEDANLNNQILVKSAVLGDTPDNGFFVTMPDGDRVAIPAATAQRMTESFGFDLTGLTRMTRLMGLSKDALPYENPIDNLMVIGGLMNALGNQQDFTVGEERHQRNLDESARLEVKLEQLRAQRPENPRQADMLAKQIERLEGHLSGANIENPRQADLHARLVGGSDIGSTTQVGVQAASARFRQGWERYQDVGLAMVHAVDQGLASRVAATGGDPAKLSPEDELRTWDVIRRTSGDLPESWLDLAPDSPLGLFRAFSKERLGIGSAGPQGPQRRVLDPVQVKQEFARMMEALLLVQPPEDVQDSVAGWLQGELDKADEGMNFDATSRILEWIRGQARYQELYGSKPSGVTEQEYLGQFLSAGQQMLGGQNTPTGALEAGLKTGQYQSTVGSIAGSEESWRNSRFMGRLNEIAQVVSEVT